MPQAPQRLSQTKRARAYINGAKIYNFQSKSKLFQQKMMNLRVWRVLPHQNPIKTKKNKRNAVFCFTKSKQ